MIHEDEDVADVTTMEEELEALPITQVELGSYILQTLMDEGTHVEEPHDKESIPITTCVSFELLEDGTYAVKGKDSLSMRWTTLPWMSMMRPCAENQGTLIVVGLVGAVCNLMAGGADARDKGGT